jgi:hypothetical protein
MRAQLYEKKKMDRAFEIISKSFTYGSKLQRNPMSLAEEEKLQEAERAEYERFQVYKRAWFLKHRKSQSIGGYNINDKNEFILDWDEIMEKKKKKEEDRRR